MMKSLQTILNTNPLVAYIDDERGDGNSIIVTLHNEYVFADEPDCGVRGFDTVKEVRDGTSPIHIQHKGVGKKIVHMGGVWEVIQVGDELNGNRYCKLLCLSPERYGKSEWHFQTMNDWIETVRLTADTKWCNAR